MKDIAARNQFVKAEVDKLKRAVERGEQECTAITVIIFLIVDGLRLREACQLKRSDYNMERKNICFLSKEEKRKEIFLSRETNKILVRYLEQRVDDNENMFPNKAGTGAIEAESVIKAIRRRLNGVGVHEIRNVCYWGTQMKKTRR